MIRYHARWVIPVGAPPLRQACVAVSGERIAYVGDRAHAPPGEDVELGDAVMLPGLVNAHTHLDLAAFGSAARGASFFSWVRTLVRGLAEASDSAAIADAAQWSVADQLAHGVTTIGHTGPDASAADAMRALGARGVAYLECFGPDPGQCETALADLSARVSRARRDDTSRVAIGVSPHAPYSVSDALYSAVAAYARAESLPVAVHIAESADETQLVTDAAGPFAGMLRARGMSVTKRATSPVALLERTRVLAIRPLCIHAVRVNDADIAMLAASGASVAHCPRANAWFGHGDAPVRALRLAGVAVGLGTDSIASNDAVRLLAEARDAADPSLGSRERIAMATIDGARALGLDGVVGTLEVGKRADITAYAVDDPAACDRDPAQFLLDHCAVHPSLLTIVDGVVRARHGRTSAMHDALDARMAEQRLRVRQWRDAPPK